ncbi:MAG: hypothetical protein IT385_18565 [Deltaproteobacteria bacterium]|nr:hypothetical protein [Deltaproteobacteria bacterium]
MRMRWLGVVWVIGVAGCADAGSSQGEPPDVEPAALCLEALPPSLAFEGEHPNDAREASLRVATCDRSAWTARFGLDGDGFVTSERLVADDGSVRARGKVLEVAAGEHVEVDVVYLARSIDDGAEAELVVRGLGADGRVGRVAVSLSGIVLQTCAECACCDESTDDELTRYTLPGEERDVFHDNDDDGCPGCTTTPNAPR